MLVTPAGTFEPAPFEKESELEASILEVEQQLFGERRHYLPYKRKIGNIGGRSNVVDGLLIDLNTAIPRLYLVENELASHPTLNHIATQVLGFTMAFKADRHKVKRILVEALESSKVVEQACEKYADVGFRNLDHLLDYMVFEREPAVLVVIDDLHDELEQVLIENLKPDIVVLELRRFSDTAGSTAYEFTPLESDAVFEAEAAEDPDVDTLVIPARPEGFEEVFLGEDRWYAVRVAESMRSQVKYIAAYVTAPESAITRIAEVESIEPWGEGGKSVINFKAPARKIGPIKLVSKSKAKAPQSIRYVSRKALLKAKTLDELW